jgi:hypothetical protein
MKPGTLPRGWGFGGRGVRSARSRIVQRCLAEPALLEVSTEPLARDLAAAFSVSRTTARGSIEQAREIARCASSALHARAA